MHLCSLARVRANVATLLLPAVSNVNDFYVNSDPAALQELSLNVIPLEWKVYQVFLFLQANMHYSSLFNINE